MVAAGAGAAEVAVRLSRLGRASFWASLAAQERSVQRALLQPPKGRPEDGEAFEEAGRLLGTGGTEEEGARPSTRGLSGGRGGGPEGTTTTGPALPPPAGRALGAGSTRGGAAGGGTTWPSTFHGPGQLVAYPVLDLRRLRLSLRAYVAALERVAVAACRRLGLPDASPRPARQATPAPGTRDGGGSWRGRHRLDGSLKACTNSEREWQGLKSKWLRDSGNCGVHCGRHITSHGLALNCCTDLTWFDHIVPCGLEGEKVTSLSQELQRHISVEEAMEPFLAAFEEVFQCTPMSGRCVLPGWASAGSGWKEGGRTGLLLLRPRLARSFCPACPRSPDAASTPSPGSGRDRQDGKPDRRLAAETGLCAEGFESDASPQGLSPAGRGGDEGDLRLHVHPVRDDLVCGDRGQFDPRVHPVGERGGQAE
ncbi:hypothetical protein JRQ81_020070 [Phrynocephalus forsythii]|uniref:BPL/LPL catalytic domain-containing protein n=1 Tax=Phrynocephalus forsythii TaxID=171643 RepID=A0A9Q1AYK1_9SAUR|nr:hypothetical protein JRQ81_020070 [Phrynocephalus forsythii]